MEKLRPTLFLILLLILSGCATRVRVKSSNFVIQPRPVVLPTLLDKSPKPCPECIRINEQEMWKFTARDFVSTKEKLIELDDYVSYLLKLLSPQK